MSRPPANTTSTVKVKMSPSPISSRKKNSIRYVNVLGYTIRFVTGLKLRVRRRRETLREMELDEMRETLIVENGGYASFRNGKCKFFCFYFMNIFLVKHT